MEEIINLASQMNKERSFEAKFEFCKSFLGLTILPNGDFETKYDGFKLF
jgi:hypothetical protein